MKKLLLFASATFLVAGLSFSRAQAQVIFSEDFQSVVTSGTPLVADLPAGWADHNVDGHTPATNVSFMSNKAWRVREVSGLKFAVSTSWYTPAAASNDWMVTPAIIIPATGNPFLKYKIYAPDAAYPDGYSVLISTTGNAVADFVSPAIYSEAAAPSTDFTPRSIDLSAYLGQTIYIAFRNTSNDKFLLYMDDLSVTMLQPNDATVTGVTLNPYSNISTNNTLGVSVTNNGSNTITSLTVDWNDGVSHSSTIGSLSIAPGVTQVVNHPTLVTYATVVEKNINLDITLVNGVVDSNTTDNQGASTFHTVSSVLQHNVLIEEGTGTWCGWCPRGKIAMDYMTTTYPSQFVGIAVHNNDPMAVTAYDAAANFSGYPGCNVERTLLDQSVSQSSFEAFYNTRKDLIVPAGLTVTNTWDYASRQIDATITAHFVTPFAAANLRLAIVVIEDEVTGATSGYNQNNYYANNVNGPMGGFESLPASVPAAQMVYDHVGRALLGGYSGQAGSVPAVIADLDNVNYTFNYTLPAGFDESKTKLVGLLINQANGNVVNAVKVDLNFNAGVPTISNNIVMNVYPNPTTDVANIQLDLLNNEDITVTLYDLSGKAVYTQRYGTLSGTQYLSIPVAELAKGQYVVSVATPSKSYSRHLMVK